jgi:Uncharacterized protein conserved in bacteria
MKEFMFIFKGATQQYDFSPEEMQQHMHSWFSWVDDLKAKKIYLAGEALSPAGGKTVQGAKLLVTDGPFAESKELVGGFISIRAASIDEAVEIAKGCPDLQLDGAVEVREIMKLNNEESQP